MAERQSIVVNGVRVFYLERRSDRESGKSPLLVLHGLLATAETVEELMSGLPSDRRIVALDLLSAQPVDSRTTLNVHFAVLAELIRGFLDGVGLVQPVVVGHSHGGVLALRLAATERGLLKGMVLLCPAHPFGGFRSHVVNFYLTRHGRFLALSIPLAPSWMILRAYNEAAGSQRRITMRHLRPYLRVLRSRNTLRRVLEMLRTWDEDMAELRTAMAEERIRTPTLLVWGDEDPVVPMASAAELEEHLESVELVTLSGMGHLLAEEAPTECAVLIRAWLDGHG